jgi:hypothetical protein
MYRWTEDDLKRVRGGGGSHMEASIRGSVTRTYPTKKISGASSTLAPSPSKPPYKSKLELSFAVTLEAMKRQGDIDGWLYEPFVFKLAEGKRYRVDFIAWKLHTVEHVDGSISAYQRVTAYECKGWHANYRDSLTHLAWAAQRFSFLQWKKVVRNGKTGFEIYDVKV